MKIRIISTVLVCAAFSLITCTVSANPATGTISGHVRDIDGKPIRGAEVILLGAQDFERTNRDGAYLFVGEDAGTQKVRVQAIGFHTCSEQVSVKQNAETSFEFILQRQTVPLNFRTGIIPGHKEPGGVRSIHIDTISERALDELPDDDLPHPRVQSR